MKLGSRIRDLINDMIKMGFKKTLSDYDLVEFGFTVVDSNNKSVPFSSIIIDFGKDGKIKIGSTDQQGNIKLSFSEELIEKNPNIYGEKAADRFGVRFSLTASADADTFKLNSVDLSTLSSIEVETDMLWFTPSLVNQWKTRGEEMLKIQRHFIQKYLGIEPIPWGAAFVDINADVSISPSTFYNKGQLITIFPYSIRRDDFTTIFSSNLHEWVEQSLDKIFSPQIPRWIADGLAEFTRIELYKTLTISERKFIGVDDAWIKRALFAGYKVLDELKKNYNEFDLLNWQYVNINYSLKDPTQRLGYLASASFWYHLTKDCDSKIVSIFLRNLMQESKLGNNEILLLLTNNCDSKYLKQMNNYPLSAIEQYLNELESEMLHEKKVKPR